MRIVAGEFGGRPLKAVPGTATRPTTDKVKEAIFSMIGPYFDGGISLDLFAGSGGLSIEGVSRGIDKAYLVDKQFAAIKTIKANIEVTKAADKFSVSKQDATVALDNFANEKIKFDVIYLDPPYAKQQILKDLAIMQKNNLLNEDAIIVTETDQSAQLPVDIPNFVQTNHKNYGITVISVYKYLGAVK
ncbi:16S rRNA (guanine(966)-N(2))-methyltransferase RsmD [Periweissella beninensis]|uniref:16S rRNA (Guanine(966)-N(2))-methyltransferase RsmD n=1 Tax=Periweissella beninensis TaxID=504936 RepID=A0ABT0VM49_9LACO|nr:16S rRNA (guanine(966)-N(2))-methyltransferase RsmD [Periweissella beninensis]MBM7544202.1 16S rRNA (guanine(966)-N(2))-methyltransferase RsmD [Periweissella beninensis]MCM2437590.1 16S rRNA (guanine(966)-N(2))-methyltransferase RsmD [Periweissella beninensis]MCT4396625.1 16S rRNA (guanine(966)-N(2))-methyltransferase RsmD [Periweissella beninensis]